MEVELDLWSSRSSDPVDHILSDVDCCNVPDVDEFILSCSSASDLAKNDLTSSVDMHLNHHQLSHHSLLDETANLGHHHHQSVSPSDDDCCDDLSSHHASLACLVEHLNEPAHQHQLVHGQQAASGSAAATAAASAATASTSSSANHQLALHHQMSSSGGQFGLSAPSSLQLLGLERSANQQQQQQHHHQYQRQTQLFDQLATGASGESGTFRQHSIGHQAAGGGPRIGVGIGIGVGVGSATVTTSSSSAPLYVSLQDPMSGQPMAMSERLVNESLVASRVDHCYILNDAAGDQQRQQQHGHLQQVVSSAASEDSSKQTYVSQSFGSAASGGVTSTSASPGLLGQHQFQPLTNSAQGQLAPFGSSGAPGAAAKASGASKPAASAKRRQASANSANSKRAKAAETSSGAGQVATQGETGSVAEAAATTNQAGGGRTSWARGKQGASKSKTVSSTCKSIGSKGPTADSPSANAAAGARTGARSKRTKQPAAAAVAAAAVANLSSLEQFGHQVGRVSPTLSSNSSSGVSSISCSSNSSSASESGDLASEQAANTGGQGEAEGANARPLPLVQPDSRPPDCGINSTSAGGATSYKGKTKANPISSSSSSNLSRQTTTTSCSSAGTAPPFKVRDPIKVELQLSEQQQQSASKQPLQPQNRRDRCKTLSPQANSTGEPTNKGESKFLEIRPSTLTTKIGDCFYFSSCRAGVD